MYTEIQGFHFMGGAPGKLINSENDFACLFWPSWGKYSVQFKKFFLPVKTGCPSAESVNETPDIQVKKVIIMVNFPYYSSLQCSSFYFNLFTYFHTYTTFRFFNPWLLPFYIGIIFYKTKPKKNKPLPIDLSNILVLLLFVLELLGNQAWRLFEKIVTEAELSWLSFVQHTIEIIIKKNTKY